MCTLKTEYIKKALAVFCIMLVSFGILYVYGQKNDGNKLRDTEEKNEENIFKLNMQDVNSHSFLFYLGFLLFLDKL